MTGKYGDEAYYYYKGVDGHLRMKHVGCMSMGSCIMGLIMMTQTHQVQLI